MTQAHPTENITFPQLLWRVVMSAVSTKLIVEVNFSVEITGTTTTGADVNK